MTIVVGYGPDTPKPSGLELARLLAEAGGEPLAVVSVILQRWDVVGTGRAVDEPFTAEMTDRGEAALAAARAALPDLQVPATFEVVTARSGAAGLVAAAEAHQAAALVLGPSPSGVWGRIALGGTTIRLLHSSPVPVACPPRGWRLVPDGRLRRISVALDGTEPDDRLLDRALELASKAGTALRVVTFAVRPGTVYAAEVPLGSPHRDVEAKWREEAFARLEAAVAEVCDRAPGGATWHLAAGDDWDEALAEPGWESPEVLLIGSSRQQALLSRVFIGSTASRIVRHAPVPVLVLP